MRLLCARFLTLCLCWFAVLPVWANRTQPNIVLLLADDWGFSDVGAFGSEIATPHLDALAKQGVRFSNFHVAASCSPTRAMLLTGVDHHRSGVGNMRETIPLEHVGKPGYLSVLDRNVVTVASLLKSNGYRTYVAGKWHVGHEPHNLPPARGFDRSIIQADSGSDNWETGKKYLDLTESVNWYEDGKPAVMPKEFYSSEYFISRTIDYLETSRSSAQPFFAYVGFQANHLPVQAPKVMTERYKGRYAMGWDVLRNQRRDRAVDMGLVAQTTRLQSNVSNPKWSALEPQEQAFAARNMEVYAGMAQAMDEQIGRLVAYLKTTGQFDNTVFVFLSDNGPEASDPYANWAGRLWLSMHYSRESERLGEKGTYGVIGPGWASAAASPFSTYKFYAGEGGIRVPLIISGVSALGANSIEHSFAHVKDITPTLLDIAKVAQVKGMFQGQAVEPITGVSLLPVLQGKTQRAHSPDKAIGYELSGNAALFKGDLKLLKNIAPLGDGQWHLFDIKTDPGETEDLKDKLPAVFEAMKADYEVYAAQNGVLPMPQGYDPIQQVLINSLVNVYMPRFKWAAWVMLALGLLVLFRWGRRRFRRQATQAC